MNTEAKHTPGPWAWDGDILTAGKSGRHLLYMEEAPGLRNEAAANLHLIAAAPELFEALDLARRYMKTCLGSSFWDGPNPYPIIDAALAKARGEFDA